MKSKYLSVLTGKTYDLEIKIVSYESEIDNSIRFHLESKINGNFFDALCYVDALSLGSNIEKMASDTMNFLEGLFSSCSYESYPEIASAKVIELQSKLIQGMEESYLIVCKMWDNKVSNSDYKRLSVLVEEMDALKSKVRSFKANIIY